MAFTTYNGITVVQATGKPSLAYVIRNDTNQIAVLDTVTPSAADFAVYYSHSFTGDTQQRAMRKKLVRVYVYGEGLINPYPGSAYMVVSADNNRSDVYPYSALSPVPAQKMLWNQNTLALVGRTFDVALFLTGTGLVIREIELQYSVVG